MNVAKGPCSHSKSHVYIQFIYTDQWGVMSLYYYIQVAKTSSSNGACIKQFVILHIQYVLECYILYACIPHNIIHACSIANVN